MSTLLANNLGTGLSLVADDTFTVGLIAESAKGPVVMPTNTRILESAEDMGTKQLRSAAMAAVLAWVEAGDGSFDAFDAILSGIAGMDEDAEEPGEASEEDILVYNDLYGYAAEALLSLGAAEADITTFLDKEDSDAGRALIAKVAGSLDGETKDDDEVISDFAVLESLIGEATIKVVRGGQVVLKQKRIRPRRITSAQRMALKVARRKSNTAAARVSRKKSLRVRKQHGM